MVEVMALGGVIEVGGKVGFWTVLEQLSNDKHGNRRWRVECRCGLTGVRQDGNLRYGRSKGCTWCMRTHIRLPGSLPLR